MARRNSRTRREQRYIEAVERQIALVAGQTRHYAYAPVEEFLRPGDTVEMFLPEEESTQ